MKSHSQLTVHGESLFDADYMGDGLGCTEQKSRDEKLLRCVLRGGGGGRGW